MAKKAKAIRHIILIRHGQYNVGGKTDADRTLTELGKCFIYVPYVLLKLMEEVIKDSKIIINFLYWYKGRQQAEATGQRLKELGLPYTEMVTSTMTRAQETAKIMQESLKTVATKDDLFLTEGAPIPPEPPIGHWKSEAHVSKLCYVIIKIESFK